MSKSFPNSARAIASRKNGFQKGHKRIGGNVKGSKHKFTMRMKDAILHAMELAGNKQQDPQTGEFTRPGPGGLAGFMEYLVLHREKLFCNAFGSKLLPLTLDGLLDPQKETLTEEEVAALCATYGVPFEKMAPAEIRSRQPKMIDVTPSESS